MKLLGLYAIRFLFYLLSKRVTNIVEILVVLDVIRLKFESGAREGGGEGGGGGGGGEERLNKSPLKLAVSFHKKIN